MARDVPRGYEGAELLEGQGGHRAAGRAVKRAPAGRRVDHTTKRSHHHSWSSWIHEISHSDFQNDAARDTEPKPLVPAFFKGAVKDKVNQAPKKEERVK